MDLKLDRLTLAMASHEGFNAIGPGVPPGGNRAYRNHNPGNLTASPFAIGSDGRFAIFAHDMDGFAAMRLDIRKKALGQTTTGLNGNSTLKDLIDVWDSGDLPITRKQYLEDVLTKTGFAATMKLSELL